MKTWSVDDRACPSEVMEEGRREKKRWQRIQAMVKLYMIGPTLSIAARAAIYKL